MHRKDYRGDTGDLRPLTVPCKQIPQHLQVEYNSDRRQLIFPMQLPVCQVIFILSNAVILRYRELWCFSSASILSITPPTQWNTAMGLEHPIIRENEFVCSTASRTTVGGVWGGGGPRLTTASVSSGPPPSNQQ